MDVGAPDPTLLADGLTLWVAYRISCDADDCFAVVRFDGVTEHRLGPPGDERIGEHPLYGRGLQFYAFHEVWGAMPDAYAPRRWVVTFHDETLEVSASRAVVVARGVGAPSARGALGAVVPGGI
jgi:hypothetical protein